MLLALLAEDGQQHLHHGGSLGFILFHFLGNRQLAHGIGQQPVILSGLTEIGQHDTIGTIFLCDGVRQRGGVAEHGSLTGSKRLRGLGEHQLLIPGLDAYILQKLLILFKDLGPHHIVQTYLVIRSLAFVGHAPLGTLQAHELRDRAALHGLQAGIVIFPVRLEALDAQLLEGIDGGYKLGVIGGQRDVVSIKQILVGDNAVHLGAHGQPADGTAGFPVHFKIAGIEGSRHLGGA